MENLDLIHNLHDIKILKGYYFSILDGSKTFEVRLDSNRGKNVAYLVVPKQKKKN